MAEESNDSGWIMEGIVRFVMIAFLLFSAARILAPFADLIVWGVILAVALAPAHLWLTRRLGGSSTWAALIITIASLLFIVVPSFMLGDALAQTAIGFADQIETGELKVRPPPPAVLDWPVIGERAYEVWSQASNDLDELLSHSSKQLVQLGGRLIRAAGHAVVVLLQFAGSILVAGFLLARRKDSSKRAKELFRRAAPASGDRLVKLCEQTVRSVASGVLGVAIIQTTLVGIGLLVAGVPFAGVWALLCLLLGIMQLPMGVIVIPIVVYQFANVPTLHAVLFMTYMVPVMLVDNVLKPLLLGRGVEAPMAVIFVGALGGFAVRGFLGLFTGAIVLVLAYELFLLWLRGAEDDGAGEAATGAKA
ncbi:MAG: AI-2E family transporter [Deltaproteobacteria bacterium]|nr:AI-2E family transporter [Deltaproteobacteria bacterium]